MANRNENSEPPINVTGITSKTSAAIPDAYPEAIAVDEIRLVARARAVEYSSAAVAYARVASRRSSSGAASHFAALTRSRASLSNSSS